MGQQHSLSNSPAICSVALRLLTFPAAFLATHQYTPPSCSFLPCTVRRKNSDPDGRRTRCDLLSLGLVFTGSPSLNHSIVGSGLPSALQFNVTGSFFGTTMSLGCSVIRGERYCAARRKEKFQLIPWKRDNCKTTGMKRWDSGKIPWRRTCLPYSNGIALGCQLRE